MCCFGRVSKIDIFSGETHEISWNHIAATTVKRSNMENTLDRHSLELGQSSSAKLSQYLG